MEPKKKIIIIEDIPLFNSMLKTLLSNKYDVVATDISAKEIPNLCEKYKPDLILTDVLTKDNQNGIIYGGEIKKKYQSKIKVLAITGIPDISFLNLAKENNLDGLIYKDVTPETLETQIEQILSGYTLFPDNYVNYKENKQFDILTPKELKILKLLCDGYDRDEIASILNITSGTLKNYISNILNKMNFDSISKLTMYCISNGYIIPHLH